ncbi:non-ribosomal peptide synthetase [Paenibacillus riograndensis]|uniref:Carrier domain-containing protein n=1 Tax=Paenibacillus riograndensis SBR5 TaxID=1073571 RepID=A0A0E4HDD5_9BACL|nr:non-ribosomal peptide synthetase [Paenibacillus riograndensis]CQR58131.1 hypothetical protein PRIO_5744 [Paenibacillus riograndensis SBR5]
MSIQNANINVLLSTSEMKKKKKYWLNRVVGSETDSRILTDPHKSALGIEGKESLRLDIPDGLFQQLQHLSNRSDDSLYYILLTALKWLIVKHTESSIITVASPVYMDENSTSEAYNHYVPIIDTFTTGMTFRESLLQVRETTLGAYDHQDYPFDKIIEDVQAISDRDFSFVRHVLCLLTNIHNDAVIPDVGSNIVFGFTRDDAGISLNLIYNLKYFTRNFVMQLAKQYFQILKGAAENVSIKLGSMSLLSAEESLKLLKEQTRTYQNMEDMTLYELFEKQVRQTPDHVAVKFNNQSITYRDLNAKANKLARVLRNQGVGANQIVGLLVERSIDMAVGILGILKSGAAYLPLDIKSPEERLQFLIEDAGIEVAVSNKQTEEKLKRDGLTVIRLDDDVLLENESDLDLILGRALDHPAYVIYTSGTTGQPKGVIIEHRSISNTIQWRKSEYSFDASDRMLQLFSYIFDGFLTSFFTPIVSGATVVFLDETEARDPLAIIQLITLHKITHFIAVPTLYSALLRNMKPEEAQSLRIVTLAGEKVTPNLLIASKQLHPGMEIVNEYGPTESSVLATLKRDLKPDDTELTIGKPIGNTRVYIVGDNLELKAAGMVGELCISGAGLARGYLHNEVLTRDKFVSNPFEANERMYRTGDLARWTTGGEIEIIGRADTQVKLRGYRIELGEIENRLLEYNGITEAVVALWEDQNDNSRICAYIVCDRVLSALELRESLSKSLPEYMLPTHFFQLEQFPMTPTGKMDRNALRNNQDLKELGARFQHPTNEIESRLVEIWKNVLEVDKVSIHDNFFMLGGHSLKATMLLSRLHKEFQVEIELDEIFEKQTICNLAALIKSKRPGTYSSILPTEKRDYYPMSSAQKRMYALYHLEGESTSYNMPEVMVMEGELDVGQVESVLRQMISRHEILRTSFHMIHHEPVQVVHDTIDFSIDYTEEKIDDIRLEADRFIQPFDLDTSPLFRVKIIKIASRHYLFMFDMHHIISDGISIGLFIKELALLYGNAVLPEPEIQFKDFSVWEKESAENGDFKQQEEFWLKMFKGEVPLLELPVDYKRPVHKSYEGSKIPFTLDKETTRKLKELAGDNGATLYMLLLALFNIMLSKITNQEDIIVGSPVTRRRQVELESVMGMFSNTLAMRNFPAGNKRFKDFLNEVKSSALSAFDNQDYQFEEMISKLDIVRDTGRNPLFDAMLILQNIAVNQFQFGEMKVSFYEHEHNISRFDITLHCLEGLDGLLHCSFEYCTRLFKRETVETMIDYLKAIVNQVIADREIRISDICMVSENAVQQILAFNQTSFDLPADQTIHGLFEEQAKRRGDEPALEFLDQTMSYGELNKRANQLARLLREKGVTAGSVVGLMFERSFEMMIGWLGILKSGGAYLPIDPDYPGERIKFMIEDSGIQLVLTQNIPYNWLDFDGEVIDLNCAGLNNMDGSNLPVINRSSDLAYMIYTSGTTGKPKGTLLEHKGIVNLTASNKEQLKIQDRERVVQFSSISFDVSLMDISMSILLGGTLCLTTKEILNDNSCFEAFLNSNRITAAILPPTYLANLNPNNIHTVDKMITIGSAISSGLVNEWKRKCEYINAYGPTETTVYSSVWIANKQGEVDDPVPIGKPILNTQMYILDKYRNLQPVGIPGELCIGGIGLTRGYWKRPEMTADKIITAADSRIGKVYRTGDLARWLPDGNLEYLGRMDEQVKIRGFRVEPQEIKAELLKIEGIKDVIVTHRKNQLQHASICAYYISAMDYSVTELRKQLLSKLPEFMIPAYFVRMEAFPLTSNGKIDQKLLPVPENSMQRHSGYIPPRNEIELMLAEVWEEVLRLEKVGIEDNFFEVGGDSLKAMQVAAILGKHRLHMEIKDLFHRQKIAELSECVRDLRNNPIVENPVGRIDSSGTEGDASIEVLCSIWLAEIKDQELRHTESIRNAPLVGKHLPAAVQKYHLMNAEKVHTSIPFRSCGDIGKIQKAILRLVNEQVLLRSVIVNDGENTYFYEHGSVYNLPFILIDLSGFDAARRSECLAYLQDHFNKLPFERDNGLLYRLVLVQTAPEDYMLLYSADHAVSDGLSLGIITDQLAAYFAGDSSLPVHSLKHHQNYWDYADQMQKGPQNLSEQQLCGMFRLAAFAAQARELEKYINSKNRHKSTMLDLVIPLRLGNKEKSHWQLALEVMIPLCGKMFGIREVPFWLVNNGRRYEENLYYDIVGDFADVIPVLAGNNQTDSLEKWIQHLVNECVKGNISFVNLMLNGGTAYPFAETSRLLEKLYSGASIMFNYYGVLQSCSEDLTLQEIAVSAEYGERAEDSNGKIGFYVWQGEDYLKLKIILPFEEDRDDLLFVLQEAAGNIQPIVTQRD